MYIATNFQFFSLDITTIRLVIFYNEFLIFNRYIRHNQHHLGNIIDRLSRMENLDIFLIASVSLQHCIMENDLDKQQTAAAGRPTSSFYPVMISQTSPLSLHAQPRLLGRLYVFMDVITAIFSSDSVCSNTPPPLHQSISWLTRSISFCQVKSTHAIPNKIETTLSDLAGINVTDTL